jgi:hypothetical protein
VAAQFGVSTARRYAPRDDQTYCNVYLWDVTASMCCEVPHWLDAQGNPAQVGAHHEMTANAIPGWLRAHPESGWREVCPAEAELQASEGHPTVATYRNPAGHGHCAVVLPSAKGLRVAAAGQRCLWDRPISEAFGARPVVLFSHP